MTTKKTKKSPPAPPKSRLLDEILALVNPDAADEIARLRAHIALNEHEGRQLLKAHWHSLPHDVADYFEALGDRG